MTLTQSSNYVLIMPDSNYFKVQYVTGNKMNFVCERTVQTSIEKMIHRVMKSISFQFISLPNLRYWKS